MEERIDLYNDLGQATGKTQLRSEELREDAWYLVVTVWVRDKGGKLFEGLLEISEFDGKRVVLTHSGGKRLFVPMGGKKRVLEIEVDD